MFSYLVSAISGLLEDAIILNNIIIIIQSIILYKVSGCGLEYDSWLTFYSKIMMLEITEK